MKSSFLKYLLILITLSSFSIAQNKIIIGTIDTEPKEKILKFRVLADYLQEKLKSKNIKVDVEIPKDIQTTIDLINSKKLDIYIDSVYPTMLVKKKTGIDIVCKRWKKGKEGYKSVIFTKKSAPIDSISDLKNKKVAFEDEFSTSAFFIPKSAMERNGLIVSNKGESGSVKYDFARSEKNAAVWVLYSKVDAAVTDDKTYSEFDKNLFKVIYTSKLIPRHLVSFSKSIDGVLKEEILEILYQMDKDKQGHDVLKKFSKTKKFSPLKAEDIELIRGLN